MIDTQAHVLADYRDGADGPRGGTLVRFGAVGGAGILGVIAVAWTLELPPAAIVVSTVAMAASLVVFAVLLRRDHPHRRLGAANVVTLTRLAVVTLLLAILLAGGGEAAVVIAVSILSLSLDGIDGWLARRQKLTSPFGATFDMEVDSAFALVLSVLAAIGPAGPAALLLGVPRYAFGIAALAVPWLNAPLAPRFSRKVACVIQLVVLIVLQLPWLASWAALALVIAASGLLLWSFAVDIASARRRALQIRTTPERPRVWRTGVVLTVQLAVSALLLVLLWRLVGGTDVASTLLRTEPVWLVAAVALLMCHTVLAALRWRVAAAPLGIPLTRAQAINEYFLAQLVNTALPGGVLGDAGRAARSRQPAGLGPATGAVVIERAIGQLALLVVFATAFVLTLAVPAGVAWPTELAVGVAVVLTALGLVVISTLVGLRGARARPHALISRLVDGVRRSLKAPDAARAHIALSAGTSVCILAAFACCAAAVGAALPVAAIAAVVPLVLWAMLLPISIGGWGVREGAAVALLPIAGIAAAEALAASIAFGLVALVAALPGFAAIWVRRRAKTPKPWLAQTGLHGRIRHGTHPPRSPDE